MVSIIEQQREIPVLNEADVIVVGGGPAGIGAALAAGRNGASTIVIEQANCLGGMQTQALNPRFVHLDEVLIGGIVRDIGKRLEKGGALFEVPSMREETGLGEVTYEPAYHFDPEYYKYLLDIMMEEAGVELLYHAFAVGAVKEGNTLKGIIIESKEGRQAILGKVIVDTTGSGDIAWKSETPCLPTGFPDGPHKGRHNGFSAGFTFREVDTDRFNAFREEHPDDWAHHLCGKKLIKKSKEEGKLHGGRGAWVMCPHLAPGMMWLIGPHHGLPMGHHGWILKDLSEGEIDLRKQAWEIYSLLKDNVGGFENAHIDQTWIHLQLRDMHRIEGEYVLTLEDIRSGRIFDDSITISTACPDIFGPDNQHQFMADVPPHDIPYRSLVAKGADNLLAAGSVISADFKTYCGERYCTPSICTGEAAGTAAALSAKNNVIPKKIDMKLLQNTLREQGAIVSLKDVPKSVVDLYLERIERIKKSPVPSLGPD